MSIKKPLICHISARGFGGKNNMASLKFSRAEFEKHVKLTEEIKEKITMFGTHLESVNDEEIEIEISPNRPDLLSFHGFMRSFLPFIGKKISKTYKVNPPIKDYEVIIDSSTKNIRPYTACAIVKALKFDDTKIKEIIDVQEKLHSTLGRNRKKIAIGIYPLEAITLPIKFRAEKPQDIRFVPLGESKEMTGLQILQQHSTGREYGHLLEGKEKFPIFVDSKGEILSMPPVINSEKTGKITQETKDVFIECSGFDFNTLKKTLNFLVTMLADMGGKIYQMKLKYGKEEITPNLTPEKMKINLDDSNKLLGLELKEIEIKKLLEKMGYQYSNKEVLIPSWRVDILHQVDIYEDIAIAYGYENLVPEIPSIATTGQEDKKAVIKRKISEILAGLNMLELSTYHLLTLDDLKKIGQKPLIEVEKSKTDYSVLRNALLNSTLKILSENIDAEYPQRIFELGKVLIPDEKQEAGIKEEEHLIVSLTPGNFTETKQVLEYLARSLDIKFEIQEAENASFIEGRVGGIIFNKKQIGIIGEIHPQILKNCHIKMPVSLFEINLEEIFEKFS